MILTATMQLIAPLHHSEFGGHKSNIVGHRKAPVVMPEGVEHVPIVSGNALRGQMRRIVMRDLLDQCGMQVGAPGYDRIYAAVANGGTLTGSDNNVNPTAIRTMREVCPPLSVFGAALYTHMLAGRMSVGICWPVCDVTLSKGLVAERHRLNGQNGLNASYLEWETSYVRLPEKERQNTEATKVEPMPYTIEIVPPGVVLESEILFAGDTTPIEMSCAAWALDRVESLGGKDGIGMGRLTMSHNGDAAPYEEWRRSVASEPAAVRAILESI